MIIIHNQSEDAVFDRLLDWLRQQPEFEAVTFTYAGSTERGHIDFKLDD